MSLLDKTSINNPSNLKDILSELTWRWRQIDTVAKADYTDFLRGQKQMLEDIIKYLEKL